MRRLDCAFCKSWDTYASHMDWGRCKPALHLHQNRWLGAEIALVIGAWNLALSYLTLCYLIGDRLALRQFGFDDLLVGNLNGFLTRSAGVETPVHLQRF